ncbi:hypothetical protein DL762_005550 [Monosporascus cannonballus]|uniref:N-acetyltransferase domain-containing protein n=1 Tax=Monosporascus cannonballus TaxID=155416 RepID=A0ABY0H8W8_9PEZI|nr:hypothetical protein DL762_005550 [Monosporascus cannonballus]
MVPRQGARTSGSREGYQKSEVAVVRDRQSCIPLTRILNDGDVVVLLTPVVPPMRQEARNDRDPFEPLGRALAERHPWIRHVPYTSRNGITSTHVGFIKRAKAVIFVISGLPIFGEPSQLEMAETARNIGEQRPQIIVACRSVQDLGLLGADSTTILEVPDYSPSQLRVAAALLFGDAAPPDNIVGDVEKIVETPRFWPPQVWDITRNDVTPVQELWNQCLPDQFRLDRFELQSLLQRDGYAMHFIVQAPESREIVGFCATYTTFVDQAGERLIGSLAVILVKPYYRKRGIGLSLYEHALRQLQRICGVDRIQLGSTFPRLLYGIPAESASVEWFERRGWQMDCQDPGRGQEATFDDFNPIIDFVEKESSRKDNMGWYDQYTNIAQDGRFSDIILGLQGSTIIATAMIYTPSDGSPAAQNLPWARTVGADVGGVTCICITDDELAMTNSKDTVMIGLLDACVTVLKRQGMNQLFLDAIKDGHDGFLSIAAITTPAYA